MRRHWSIDILISLCNTEHSLQLEVSQPVGRYEHENQEGKITASLMNSASGIGLTSRIIDYFSITVMKQSCGTLTR